MIKQNFHGLSFCTTLAIMHFFLSSRLYNTKIDKIYIEYRSAYQEKQSFWFDLECENVPIFKKLKLWLHFFIDSLID